MRAIIYLNFHITIFSFLVLRQMSGAQFG